MSAEFFKWKHIIHSSLRKQCPLMLWCFHAEWKIRLTVLVIPCLCSTSIICILFWILVELCKILIKTLWYSMGFGVIDHIRLVLLDDNAK